MTAFAAPEPNQVAMAARSFQDVREAYTFAFLHRYDEMMLRADQEAIRHR